VYNIGHGNLVEAVTVVIVFQKNYCFISSTAQVINSTEARVYRGKATAMPRIFDCIVIWFSRVRKTFWWPGDDSLLMDFAPSYARRRPTDQPFYTAFDTIMISVNRFHINSTLLFEKYYTNESNFSYGS